MQVILAAVLGLIFGIGILVSGMGNPAKVLGFFDIAGRWNPSLAFVMAAAALVTAIGYRLVFLRKAPVLADAFALPTISRIEPILLAGSAVFGIGWGITGFCPGGVIPMLAAGHNEPIIFVAGLMLGLLATRSINWVAARNYQTKAQQAHSQAPSHRESAMTYPIDTSLKPDVTAFFERDTNTISYVVRDPASNACAIIDSVMDIDYAAGRISYASADRLIDHIQSHGLTLEWLIETHAHADHLSAAPYIQGKLGGKLGIGEYITTVQEVFGKVFNEGTEFQRDGSQFDRLFKDGDTYTIGTMRAFVIYTPGHTPACTTHVIGNAAFVGDTLFMPDGGTARADFPGGDARVLFRSTRKLLETLPPETRLFMCHDYGPNGRDIRWETTVAEERANNIHVRDGISEDSFVQMREARDAMLGMPRLIVPSLQVNIRAGHLPEPDASGKRFLKVPVNGL